MPGTASARLAVLLQARRAVQVAVVLWLTLAIVVWNAVFDRILVVAGGEYVRAALEAANGQGPYIRVDDWMRSAVRRALWIASLAGGGVLAVGLVSIAIACRRTHSENLQSEMKSAI